VEYGHMSVQSLITTYLLHIIEALGISAYLIATRRTATFVM